MPAASRMQRGTWPPGELVRIEQNIAADIMRLTPAVLYQSTGAIRLWGRDIRVDDIRFSNSMTTERNSLLPGSIGQVAYRERWEGTGGSPTPIYGGSAHGGGERRWNAYNHIGNVVGTSNASGYFVEAVNTDAFGNPLASTQTGEWGGGLGGNRGLTTKELDPAAGMYYFYQRWYDPQTATFASRAPYSPDVEHPYNAAAQRPTRVIDPLGMLPTVVGGDEYQQGLVRKALARACGRLPGLRPHLFGILQKHDGWTLSESFFESRREGRGREMRERRHRREANCLDECLNGICGDSSIKVQIDGFSCWKETRLGYTRLLFTKSRIWVCPVAITDSGTEGDPSRTIDNTIMHEFTHLCRGRSEPVPTAVGRWFETR